MKRLLGTFIGLCSLAQAGWYEKETDPCFIFPKLDRQKLSELAFPIEGGERYRLVYSYQRVSYVTVFHYDPYFRETTSAAPVKWSTKVQRPLEAPNVYQILDQVENIQKAHALDLCS